MVSYESSHDLSRLPRSRLLSYRELWLNLIPCYPPLDELPKIGDRFAVYRSAFATISVLLSPTLIIVRLLHRVSYTLPPSFRNGFLLRLGYRRAHTFLVARVINNDGRA